MVKNLNGLYLSNETLLKLRLMNWFSATGWIHTSSFFRNKKRGPPKTASEG